MGTLKKANMLFLTKEATNKDQKLKMEMLMSTTDDKKILRLYGTKIASFQIKRESLLFLKTTFLKIALSTLATLS